MTARQSIRPLLSAGCTCLAVMVLTHVAERFNILPIMGWGLPNSPGHTAEASKPKPAAKAEA